MTRWTLLLLTAILALVGAVLLISPAASQDTQPRPKPKKSREPLRLPNLTNEARAMWEVERSELHSRLTKSRHTLTFWRQRGLWLRATRTEKCFQVPWQRSCTIARANYKLHLMREKIAVYRLKHELPNTNDWVTAVRIVQRVYPGTDDWMLAISDREGGRGAWVWYGGRHWTGHHIGNDFLGADTVGGWMQFRWSTFAPYWRGAIKDLRARGYIIPDFGDGYGPWLAPLGQALTAGYMRYYGKDGCHWCL